MKIKHILHIFPVLLVCLTIACCSDEDPIEEIDNGGNKKPDEDGWTAPGYADDYSSISGWNQRSQWNLANVHDPTIEKCGDYYYMYGTDASYGNAHEQGAGHFPYRRSKDLVNWDFQGMAMTQVPVWVKDSLNNKRARFNLAPIEKPAFGYWAPVVRKVGDIYRMYYSIVISNYIGNGLVTTDENFDNTWAERAFIGLMESTNLADNIWEDKGMVVCSVSDREGQWKRNGSNDWNGYYKYNAIDPSFIITPEGEHWLVYGSWHSGIGAIKLDPATGRPFKFETHEDVTRIFTRKNGDRWQGSEAPEIMYNEKTGYYYLFLAYDELGVAYNTRVCRSKSITGPYESITGTNVTAGGDAWPMITHPYKFSNHSGWVGFSHCCIFRDDKGDWFYCSQARLPNGTGGNEYANAIMMGFVNPIRWTEEGWPVVMPERYAGVPEKEIKAADMIGEWECILFDYQYQTQQQSQKLILATNGSASGAIDGNWSYDAINKRLKIGNYTMEVDRGLDWEANPRERTLVFSGLTTDGKPIWGKMISE